ncbi:hypothetical protein [Streptomyces sp. NPDC088719]|uniref:hypothetical protein n=1 Tax=Streptomyces sp. NPDC088719 TaxID=3365872 RepID=UPI003830F7CD
MTTVRVSAAVMTHPRRARLAEGLARRTGIPCVVADPEPAGRPNALRTSAEAWSRTTDDATHHLVVQDDIEPSAALLSTAHKAAARFPGRAIAFYTNWDCRNASAVRLAALAGAGWVSAIDGEYTPTLALLLPGRHARGFARYARRLVPTHTDDDEVMTEYLAAREVPVLLSVPNLVDHLDVTSIAGNNPEGERRACCYAPGQVPASGVLTGFTAVPHFRAGQLRVLVRGDGRPPRWTSTPWTTAGESLGVDIVRLEDDWRAWQGRSPEATALADRFGTTALRSLWAAGFLLGHAARTLGTGRDPVAGLRSEALRTLAVGGLLTLTRDTGAGETAHRLRLLADSGARSGEKAAATRGFVPHARATAQAPSGETPGGEREAPAEGTPRGERDCTPSS